MIIITNPKISGFDPVWTRFYGFSLLFDNPNNHFKPMINGLGKLDCAVEKDPDLLYYKGLADLVNGI
jgi:hypothetical protein